MQTQNLRRVIGAACVAFLLVACSREADNPYAKFKDPPLTQATLHTVTLVSNDLAISDQLQKQGYSLNVYPTNYPASIPVEAEIWGVAEEVAGKAIELKSPLPHQPNVRLLVMPLAEPGPNAAASTATDAAFFKAVLGTSVPHWPADGKLPANVRVQAWTYSIASVMKASQRLRENNIPVVFNAVAITTSYLGDHKTMAVRAPDGTPIELMEAAAQ